LAPFYIFLPAAASVWCLNKSVAFIILVSMFENLFKKCVLKLFVKAKIIYDHT